MSAGDRKPQTRRCFLGHVPRLKGPERLVGPRSSMGPRVSWSMSSSTRGTLVSWRVCGMFWGRLPCLRGSPCGGRPLSDSVYGRRTSPAGGDSSIFKPPQWKFVKLQRILQLGWSHQKRDFDFDYWGPSHWIKAAGWPSASLKGISCGHWTHLAAARRCPRCGMLRTFHAA